MPTGLLIGAAIVGTGLAVAGTVKSTKAAKEANAAQKDMIAQEQEQDKIRKQAMELDAKRKGTENIRQMQRQRALAVTSATNQGADLGSGLPGGVAQGSGEGFWNALGIDQNLGFGEQIFTSNQLLSQAKIRYANAQSKAATGAGLTSLGGSLISSASTIKNLGGNLFGGGNYDVAGSNGQRYSLDPRGVA